MHTHLILYHCIADILNQTAKSIGILDIVEEALDLPLFFHLGQTRTNVFQFSGNCRASDPALESGERRLTVSASSSLPPP